MIIHIIFDDLPTEKCVFSYNIMNMKLVRGREEEIIISFYALSIYWVLQLVNSVS